MANKRNNNKRKQRRYASPKFAFLSMYQKQPEKHHPYLVFLEAKGLL